MFNTGSGSGSRSSASLGSRRRGFTLVELMVTLSVAAILLAIAAPSFDDAVGTSRLSGTVSELSSAVQLARSEAIRRNRRATLCRSDDGSTCSSGAGSWGGWIVFVDADSSGQRDGTETVVKSGSFGSPLQLLPSAAITALNNRITFRGDGIARNSDGFTLLNATLAVCVAAVRPAQNVREFNLAFGTRATLRQRDGGGACTAPEDV